MQALRLLLLAALLLFLVFGEAPDRTRFWAALFDLGHAPLMGTAALLIRGLVTARDPERHRASQRRASLLAFAFTLALGAATEGLQLFQPRRTASFVDLARDGVGAGAFLLLWEAAAAARRAGGLWRPTRGSVAAATVALALLLGAGATFARTLALYAERNRALPTLFALDGSWWERELVSSGRSRLVPGTPLARLDLSPGRYPGVTFNEPYPDWRGYRRLVLRIDSDLEAPLAMAIRIDDAAHNQRFTDRFNRRLVVRPGQNRYEIAIDDIRRAPKGREMDLRRIRTILLFTARLAHPAHVFVGPLRLEK